MAGEVSKDIPAKELWGGKRSPFSMSYGKMMMWFFLVSDALTFSGLLVAYGFTRHASTDIWPAGEEVFRSMPFLGDGYPLLYVALMTFILIVSSVTMVLAVEAGHRMDKKGVMKWMVLTVVGGFFFVGSQGWEWYHFIHGSHDGIVSIEHVINDSEVDPKGKAKFFQEHGTYFRPVQEGDQPLAYVAINDGFIFKGDTAIYLRDYIHKVETIKDENGVDLKYPLHVDHIHGANMEINEYQPQIPQYANFFFFITGFHGFHVFSGVIINLIVTIMAFKGVFHRRGHYEMIEKAGLYWHFVDLVWVFVFTFFYLV